MSAVIKVEDLSKCYFITHHHTGFSKDSFKDVISQKLRLSKKDNIIPPSKEEFWALKNVNFEINQGERIGIIGKNGAGKSTLLKILSRITEPTSGRITINGRIASLLEVGTGFHPELNGRENIFLSGAILGMSKIEIKKKFDEIVAFSGIEKFIDTPVKRYSSGMYVRLAFSVSAHLISEILILDEVLAVGDIDFQKKCMQKMKEISGQGRTILFVSHDIGAISAITEKTLLLKNGVVEFFGKTEDATSQYMVTSKVVTDLSIKKSGGILKPTISDGILHTSLVDDIHENGKEFKIKLKIKSSSAYKGLCISLQVCDNNYRNYVHVWKYDLDLNPDQNGITTVICNFPKLRLFAGKYFFKANLMEAPGGESLHIVENFCPFEVIMPEKRLFPYYPDECAYIEEAEWQIINN